MPGEVNCCVIEIMKDLENYKQENKQYVGNILQLSSDNNELYDLASKTVIEKDEAIYAWAEYHDQVVRRLSTTIRSLQRRLDEFESNASYRSRFGA